MDHPGHPDKTFRAVLSVLLLLAAVACDTGDKAQERISSDQPKQSAHSDLCSRVIASSVDDGVKALNSAIRQRQLAAIRASVELTRVDRDAEDAVRHGDIGAIERTFRRMCQIKEQADHAMAESIELCICRGSMGGDIDTCNKLHDEWREQGLLMLGLIRARMGSGKIDPCEIYSTRKK